MKHLLVLFLSLCMSTITAVEPLTKTTAAIKKRINESPLIKTTAAIKRQTANAKIKGMNQEQKNDALIQATKAGDVEEIKLLLDHGADALGHNEAGTSALVEASKKGDLTILKILMPTWAFMNEKECYRAWNASANKTIWDYIDSLRRGYGEAMHEGR